MKKTVEVISTLALGLAFLFVGLKAKGILALKSEYDVEQFFPRDDQTLQFAEVIKKKYKLENNPAAALVLSYSDKRFWTLPTEARKLETLSELLTVDPRIKQVVSFSNINGSIQDQKTIQVGKLIHILNPAKWKTAFQKDALITPGFLSKDLRTALVYVELKSADIAENRVLFEDLRKQVQSTLPGVELKVGGIPALQSDFKILLENEMFRFVGSALAMSLIVIILIFANLSAWIAAMIILTLGSLAVLIFMVSMGWPLTVLTVTAPILVAVTILSQVIHTFFRLNELQDRSWQNILYCHKKILLPNLLSSATTAVGFLTLYLSEVPLIANYGKVVGSTISLAWLSTTLLTVPLSLIFPLPQTRLWVTGRARWIHQILHWKKSAVVTVVGVSAVSCLGLLQLNWGSKLFDDLPSNNPSRSTTELIDQKLGGLIPLEVEISKTQTDSWVDPLSLEKFRLLVKEIRTLPGVGQVLGYADFLAEGTSNNRQAIAETFFLYSLAENNPLNHFMSNDGKSVRLAVRLQDLPGDAMEKLVGMIESQVQIHFPKDLVRSSGMAVHIHPTNNRVAKNLIFGFWHALLIIGVLLAIIFRSFQLAVLACLPNLVPPALLIGGLALSQTPIKPALALVFSISLGLAFNNTVYLLTRLIDLRLQGREGRLIEHVFQREGNACFFATLVIIAGFSVFLFATFSVNRIFGLFMILSLIGGIVGDLLFLPSLLKWMPNLLGNSWAISTSTDKN